MSQTDHISPAPPPERAFIGLNSYVERDAEWFAGREDETAQLRTLVQDYPFVLLTGYDGVGKTSLVRAGLLPRCRANAWHCVYLALQDACAPDNASRATRNLRDLLDELVGEVSPFGGTFASGFDRLTQLHPDTVILVALDGFECLAQGADPAIAASLHQALESAAASRWPGLRVLIIYRGDAEPDVGPSLQRIVNLPSGPPRFYLLPLSPATAASILRTGLEAAGVTLADPGLISTLVKELQSIHSRPRQASGTGDEQHGAPAILPSDLQMVGQTLCQVAADNAGVLTAGLCEELGGVPAVLDNYLAWQLERFGERRAEAEKVLVGLVRYGRQSERQLQEHTGLKAELTQEDWSHLLTDLSAARLLRLGDDPLGVRQVEVPHALLAEMVQRETVRQERELRRLRGTLALRAAAQEQGPVVMSSDVMAELYQWRERIVPSPVELRLLLHNGLLERGPAWYWLRRVPVVGIRRFLTQAIETSLPGLHRAGGQALVAAATVNEAGWLHTLLQDDDPDVRKAAARGLVEIIPAMGRDDALALRYLLEAPDAAVRRAASEALALVLAGVGRDILPDLPELLRDEDLEVRYIAEQTLSRVASRQDVPLLRQMLQDEDLNVLNAAWGVLTQVLAHTPVEELGRLRALLADNDPYVQGAAREALAHIVSQLGPADESLLRDLAQSDDPNVRRKAALALVRAVSAPDARVAPQERLDLLRPLLDDWDADVRHAAGRALADTLAAFARAGDDAVGQADALAELRAKMDSPDRPVRLAFAQAVTRLLARKGRASIPELRQLLDDPDPDVRQAARRALEDLLAQVGREAIPDLQAMLEDSNWDVWQASGLALARVLAELGRPGLRELRLLLKEGEDPEVRRAGSQALAGVLRDLGRVALPELQRMLQDEDLFVQRTGGRALAQVLEESGARGIPDLTQLLQNTDPEISQSACQALLGVTARMKQDALPILRDLLAQDHPAVRDAAQAALNDVAQRLGRRAIPFLHEMLHDRHPIPRHAAAAAITVLDPVRGLGAWSELVVAYPLDNEKATQALVTLDRQLYCPFAETWQSRVAGVAADIGGALSSVTHDIEGAN